MTTLRGLHHVTAICGDAQENLDFYVGTLGLRLVKRSVNQDDPGTYHLFYADAAGTPGTDLTFFPWPRMGPPRSGHGTAPELSLAVPAGSLEVWRDRLTRGGAEVREIERRFGERALPLRDPHGFPLALCELESPRAFAPWPESPVEEAMQVRGLHGARLRVRDRARTTHFLAAALGFRRLGEEGSWERWGVADGASGTWIDLFDDTEARRGNWGVGAVHHLAWRVESAREQEPLRTAIRAAGVATSETIDRFWFRSVYFREPGGVLFELATDGPGFAVDEAPEALGERLVLPPWLEPERAAIERALPPLVVPGGAR